MLTIRKSTDRGAFRNDWLDSRHSFSFGEYYDPAYMGFASLRVINEDFIAPGAGFPTHPHRDMEIVTWVLEGELAHKDSTGTAATIRPGELQRMSAGTGIRHSEFNASATGRVHLLQIWLLPGQQGLPPSYEQTNIASRIEGRLGLVGAPDGADGAITIHQDVRLYAGRLPEGTAAGLNLAPTRAAWVQMARGSATLNGTALAQGDGAAVTGAGRIDLMATTPAEILVFDMAA